MALAIEKLLHYILAQDEIALIPLYLFFERLTYYHINIILGSYIYTGTLNKDNLKPILGSRIFTWAQAGSVPIIHHLNFGVQKPQYP